MLLRDARQEARHVHQRQNRDIKAVAGANEPRGFITGINVQHARDALRVVGDNPHRAPAQPGKAADHVLREVRLYLQKIAVIDNHLDDFQHRVWLFLIGVDDLE